jgi:hypothetical protein
MTASLRARRSAMVFSSDRLLVVRSHPLAYSEGSLGIGTMTRNEPAGIRIARVVLMPSSFGMDNRPLSSTETTGTAINQRSDFAQL